MAKPDFSNELQTLADRSKRLRAIVADQKKEESGEGMNQHEDQPELTAIKSIGPDRDSIQSIPEPSNANALSEGSLSDSVEQLIESDNPSRLANAHREWSRRLTYISTRIPEDMRNLIDDLLFILKKEAKKDLGREPTLQDLACEAWSDLLGKYRERITR